MRHVIRRALWRENFIDALRLVGQASARLPFGVPDPVLHGSSAIELYTGGLWSAADLDLYTLEPRPLIAELFGMGFRWAERPRSGGRGLWHPEVHIGINIFSGGASSDLAKLSNVLTVINDLDLEQHAQASLKVIGIEDLIVAQVAGCSMFRTPFSEAASLTRVLVALAREGVGGRFRAGYLQRRLTWDTDGAVVLEGELRGQAVGCDPVPRFTGLTHMPAAPCGAGGCREYGPISVTSGCKTSAIEPRFASRAPRPDADHQISISGVLSWMLSTTEGDDGSGPASRSAVRSGRTGDVLVRYREVKWEGAAA